MQNSPLDLDVKPVRGYRTIFNQVITCSAQPLCVAIHDDGTMYVGSEAKCIYIFEQSGKLGRTISSAGNGIAQFGRPTGIAIKGDVLYVADQNHSCIYVLTVEGRFLRAIGVKGLGYGQLMQPVAVVICSDDSLIVSDFANHRILIFNKDGGCLLTIDGLTDDESAFKQPWGLALDPQGNIHVAAYGSSTIKVFSIGGDYLRKYGDLDGPSGIACDDEGYSIVSEGDGNRLSIFDPCGNVIHIVHKLKNPFCTVLDDKHCCLYVADRNSLSVLKYFMY